MSRLALLLAATIVAASLLVSPNFRWTGDGERMPYAGDFLNEWIGGYIVRAGDRARLYDPTYFVPLQHDAGLVGFRLHADRYVPMVYPPVYYLAVSGLSALPYREAAWIWVTLALACFALTATLASRALGPTGVVGRTVPVRDPRWERIRPICALATLPLAVSFMPFAENLLSGQKGTWWLLILTIAFLALRSGRPLVAGLAFGLLAMKPQLAVVVPLALLAKGEWRFAAGCGITAAILVAVSLVMGPDLALAYARFAADSADFIRRQPGYVHRLHGLYGFFTLLAGEPTAAVRWATLGATGLVAALVVRLLRGPIDVTAPRFLVQVSGLVVATALVSPHVLTYDLTILLLPLVLLGFMVLRGAFRGAEGRAVLWLLVASYVACGVSPSIASRTRIQLTTPILLALLAVLARHAGSAATLTEHPSARHTG